jgi:hypothetical protein
MSKAHRVVILILVSANNPYVLAMNVFLMQVSSMSSKKPNVCAVSVYRANQTMCSVAVTANMTVTVQPVPLAQSRLHY